MRHTLPASFATIAIALGLALTAVGISRALPYEVGGIGDRSSVAADVWAHGSAVSPPLVMLVIVGLLAAIAARPGRGGARAASWLAVLGSVGIVAGAMEPVQGRILLLQDLDPTLTPLVFGAYAALIGLVVGSVLRFRSERPRPRRVAATRGTATTAVAGA